MLIGVLIWMVMARPAKSVRVSAKSAQALPVPLAVLPPLGPLVWAKSAKWPVMW